MGRVFPISMKYGTKLLLLFVGVAALTNGLLLLLSYRHAEKMLRAQMDTTSLSIAATTAALLDGEAHKTLKSRADEESPSYQRLVAQLRKVRDANRRPDLQVKYIYTLMPEPGVKDHLVFALDAEEEGPDKSHLGDVQKYKSEDEKPTRIDELQVQPDFVEDQWGVWLSANAPLRDAQGTAIAAVGVDVSAAEVTHRLDSLLYTGLAALGAAILLAVAVAIILSRRVTRPLASLRTALLAVGAGNLETHLPAESRDEFGEVASAVNEMISGLRQREMLKGTLVRYLSSQFAERLTSAGELPELRGERKKITILFADVRGFTSLSETLPPEDVVAILNEYFGQMVEAISRHEGLLNKFLGDGLMAIFGALQEDNYQEEHALRAALQMREAMVALQVRFRVERQIDLRIGIGINTGLAVVGNIGAESHMEFTAIGDAVNLASRMESQAKEIERGIVVSEYTYIAARSRFQFEPLGALPVKGRSEAVSAFALLRENVVAEGTAEAGPVTR